MNKTAKRASVLTRLLVVLAMLAASLIGAGLVASPAFAASCGDVLTTTNGVDVISNGADDSTANSCGGTTQNTAMTPGGTSVTTGYEWQCVEFVNRYYALKGWISSHWSGNGSTLKDSLPTGLTYMANGSITSITVGDVVTLNYSTFGHAGVVSNVTGNTITIANQNAGTVYRTATYDPVNKTLTSELGGSYTSQGVIHATLNTSSGTSSGNVNSGDLAFVNKNYYGGQAQLIAYSSSSGFGTLSQLATTGLASTTDSNTIPMFKPNGDLAFVNTNYSGGNVQVLAYGASSSFGTLVQNVMAGAGSYSDPNTIPMFRPNGDLAFVNTNYYGGHVQINTYSASSNYATLTQSVTAGMGSYSDLHTVPMFNPDGDLVFVNENYYTGNVQVNTYSASSGFSTLIQSVTAGMGSYSDLNTVPMFKPDGSLTFVNKNYYGGQVQVLAYSKSSNYGTLVQNTTAGLASTTDPYTIPMFKP